MDKNKEEEVWKEIPNYEGKYMVSDQGNVKSLNFNRTGKERLLKQTPGGDGGSYLRVSLWKDNRSKHYKVHQLVSMAFLGHVPCGMDIVVDHIDNDSLNNNLNNLQLITARENVSKDIDKINTSSKYSGVCWSKKSNKWKARITICGKRKHLGYFTNELEASESYQEALKNLI